jgi:mycothiol synthase
MSDEQQVQLFMRRLDVADLPEVQLDEGYTLRTFQKGDEAAWDEIIADSFDNDTMHFPEVIGKAEGFLPERTFMIFCGDEPVATTAMLLSREGPGTEVGAKTGYVHWVGAKKSHAGHRLGYNVVLATMHRIRDEGFEYIGLSTDDFRVPAIVTYLKLGFDPVMVNEGMRARWIKIFDTINKPELTDQYRDLLEGPIVGYAEP